MQRADTLATSPRTVDALLDRAFWLDAAAHGGRALLILALALAVLFVIARIKRRWQRRVQDLPALDPQRRRVLTLSGLIGSTAKYVVWLVAGMMILAEIGLDVGPLLAGAGVAGLAIGFGAQTLVKDVISGVFLLFDDTLRVGDSLRFNNESGTVEYIGLRLIKLRKLDGEVLMIPAGELRVFGNRSVGFTRVIVEVGLPYDRDVDEAIAALEDVAQEWAARAENRAVMLEEKPEVQAGLALGDAAVTARVIVQVKPGEQDRAERDLRRLIRKRFDERGIEIPSPRRTVVVRAAPGVGPVSPEHAAAAGADDEPGPAGT